MKKRLTTGWFSLFLLAAVMGGLGYVRFPALASSAVPQINAFRVSSPTIRSGEAVTLSWELSGSNLAGNNPAQLFSAESAATYPGTSVKVEPTLSTSYTLIARNRRGSDQQTQRVEVRGIKVASVSGSTVSGRTSGGAESGGSASNSTEDSTEAPEGTLGVGLSPDGPFVNDDERGIDSRDDERVLEVAPGEEFFIEVMYADPDGIARVAPLLVNGRPEGLAGDLAPDRPPFSVVGAPTGDCRLGLLPTTVRCVFRVRVAEDARNISELPGSGDEFAYVFRSRAADGLGNSVNRPVRGYVAVTSE